MEQEEVCRRRRGYGSDGEKESERGVVVVSLGEDVKSKSG